MLGVNVAGFGCVLRSELMHIEIENEKVLCDIELTKMLYTSSRDVHNRRTRYKRLVAFRSFNCRSQTDSISLICIDVPASFRT